MHVVDRVMNDGWMDEWMYVHIDVLTSMIIIVGVSFPDMEG